AIVGLEGHGAGQRARVVAGVGVLHRAQGGVVVGERVVTGQGQRAGRGAPAAGDGGSVGEAQHVLAGEVVAGDLDGGRLEVSVIHVTDGQPAVDGGGRLILGVGGAAAS